MAAVSERANKSLQVLIYKYPSAKETTRYLDELDRLTDSYNSRPHRSLKEMMPNEADEAANPPKATKCSPTLLYIAAQL